MQVRDVSILKNEDNKFAFQILTRGEIQFTSDYIYDKVVNLENNIEHFLCEDHILLQQGGLYGIFDGWECKMIIPIEYVHIRQIQHHSTVIFICQLPGKAGYHMRDKSGHKINLTTFKNLMYIGEYFTTNQYLYFFEDENGVGVVSTEGHIIIPSKPNYIIEHFRHNKNTDYIIIRKYVEPEEVLEDEEELEKPMPLLFDVYLADGTLRYENVTNFNFLAI